MPQNDATQAQNVRRLVVALVNAVIFDLPLLPAMRVDFGLSTDDHRDALYDAIDAAFDKLAVLEPIAAELDEALGDGEKITAFVRKYAPWHAEITFSAQPLNP